VLRGSNSVMVSPAIRRWHMTRASLIVKDFRLVHYAAIIPAGCIANFTIMIVSSRRLTSVFQEDLKAIFRIFLRFVRLLASESFYSYFHYDGANIKTIGRKNRLLDQLRLSATYADIPLAAICQTASTRSPRMAYIWLYKFTTGSQCETISSTLSPTL